MEQRLEKVSPNTSIEDISPKQELLFIQSNNTSPSSQNSQSLNRVLEYRLNQILKQRTKAADSTNLHLQRMKIAVMNQLDDINNITQALNPKRSRSSTKQI